MSKNTPASPDYTGAAQQQAQSSREVTEQQTWANRPTINTPFGQQTWEVKPVWDPSTGQYINSWTQNTNLTPESQQALNSQMQIQQGRSDLANSLLGRAQQEYSQPMNWSQFTPMAQTPQGGAMPNVPNYTPQNIQNNVGVQNQYTPQQFQGSVQTGQYSPGQLQNSVGTENVQRSIQTGQYSPEQIQRGLDTSGLQNVDPSQRYVQSAGDAIYGQWSNRQEPLMQQQKDQLRTQLFNQGVKEGDAAYDQAMNNLANQQSDARNMAQYQATIGAGQEAQRMFGMDLANNQNQFNQLQGAGQFANQAAQQALNQQLGIGGQRYQEGLGAGNFANQAAQQAFNQNLAAGQFYNQAGQQAYNQNFQNQQQGFNERMQNAQLGNQAAQSNLEQQLGIGGQRFNEALQSGQFSNQAAAQALQQQLGIGSQQYNQQLSNQQNQYNQAMQSANYQNQLRQQQIAEQMQQRGFSLNEINAILNGQQVSMPNMPGFNTANASQAAQYNTAAQNQGQYNLDAFSAQQAGLNSALSGAGSMAMMFSDRRLKKDIKYIKTMGNGLKVYEFRYLDDADDAHPVTGYIADEVERLYPEAVSEFYGMKMVDYGRLGKPV